MGEPVPEKNFWTLWSKDRLIQTDTPTIWLGATPSGLVAPSQMVGVCPPPSSSMFLQAKCPSCRPTNSVKAPKATSPKFHKNPSTTFRLMLPANRQTNKQMAVKTVSLQM